MESLSWSDTLKRNNIGICCLQETEVINGFPEEILNCNDFNLELERNTVKKRAGIYVRKDIKYRRCTELEEEGMHIVIIDVILDVKIRIIGLYRSFRPELLSPNEFFKRQLIVLSNAVVKNTMVLGDFNLDAGMEARQDYVYKMPLELLSNFALEKNLLQLVNFNTWSRSI